MEVKGCQGRRGTVPSVSVEGHPHEATSQVMGGGGNHQALVLGDRGRVKRQRGHRCVVDTTRKGRILRVVEYPDVPIVRRNDKVSGMDRVRFGGM